MHTELDTPDRAILAALESDGRLTNHELADAVGLSASQCSRRRTRLEQEGIIRGYRARVDGRYLGREVTVLVNVRLSAHSRDNAQRFRTFIQALQPVTRAYALAGEADYQLTIQVESLEALSRFLSDQLLAHETVEQIHSSVVLELLK